MRLFLSYSSRTIICAFYSDVIIFFLVCMSCCFLHTPLSFPRCNCVLAVAIVLLCSWYSHVCQIFFSCSLCQKQLLYTPTLAYSVNVMSLSARCSGQCIGTSLLRSLAGGSWRLAGHGWLRTQQSRWEYVGLLPHLWRMYRCVLFLTPNIDAGSAYCNHGNDWLAAPASPIG